MLSLTFRLNEVLRQRVRRDPGSKRVVLGQAPCWLPVLVVQKKEMIWFLRRVVSSTGILKHPCYFGVDETPSSSVAQKLENRFQLVLEMD